MTHVRVKPAREGESLVHPLDGPLAAEGGLWRRDQFTFKRLRDGDVVEIKEPEAPTEPDARTAPEGDAEKSSQVLATRDLSGATHADLKAAEPSPAGTVASVPFMITAANRKRLKALGKTDDEIANMKPEEAQAILAGSDAPAPEGPSAADAPKE